MTFLRRFSVVCLLSGIGALAAGGFARGAKVPSQESPAVGKSWGQPTALDISPTSVTVTSGQEHHFKAEEGFSSGHSRAVHPEWLASQGGLITPEGNFTAPVVPGAYRIEASLDGLSASAQVSVVAPPDATIISPSVVTEGVAGLMAHVADVPGSTYEWKIAGGTLTSSSNGSSVVFTAPASGWIHLKCRVTNAAGKSDHGELKIQTVPPPQILTFAASRSVITQGDAITFQVSYLNGQGDLEPGIGSVASGASPTVQPAQTTTYTLSVTNAAGTTVIATQLVTVVPPPDATLTTPATVTTGLSGFAASVPTQPGSTYAWTLSNGSLAGNGTPQVTFTAGGVGTMQIGCTVTNAAGRSAAGTRTLPVLPMPTITAFSAAPTLITMGGTSTLTLQFQDGSGRVDPGVGAVTSGSLPVKPLASTTYTLTVDNGAGGVITRSVLVTVVPPPDPTITTDAIETQGTPDHVASVPDAPNSTFVWSVTGGSISTGQGTHQISYSVGTGTAATVQCIVTNAAGTSATGTKALQLVAPPDGTLTAPGIVTSGVTGLIASVLDQPGCTFAWTVDGGTVTSGSGTRTISFTAGPVGTLHVACLVTNAAGTAVTGARDLQVVAPPAIQDFTADPSTINAGQPATLSFHFAGGVGTLDQGVGAVQSGVSVGVMPSTTTTYTLTVTNAAGTTLTQAVSVQVNPTGPGSVVLNSPSLVRLNPGRPVPILSRHHRYGWAWGASPPWAKSSIRERPASRAMEHPGTRGRDD